MYQQGPVIQGQVVQPTVTFAFNAKAPLGLEFLNPSHNNGLVIVHRVEGQFQSRPELVGMMLTHVQGQPVGQATQMGHTMLGLRGQPTTAMLNFQMVVGGC